MQIQWNERGRGRIPAVIAAIAAAALQLTAGIWEGVALPVNLVIAALLAALACFAFGARIRVRRWWGMLLALGFVAVTSTIILHVPLMHWMDEDSDRLLRVGSSLMRMTGVTLNGYARGISIAVVAVGLAFALTANLKWFGAAWLTFCCALGLADAEILLFSGNAITINDIAAIDTALNVAGNFRVEIMPLMLTQLALYICCMAIVLRAREERPRLKKPWVRLIALACVAAAVLPIKYTMEHRRGSTFGMNGVRRNSVLMEFLLELKYLHIAEPAGYSPEAAAALGEKYPAQPATVSDEKRPHVIAIMIEAFSDLSVVGDFETNIDYMPFTRELMQQSVSGQLLVSTLGGGTARSEWEFLTGNTMGFMPGGSVAFRQYMDDDENSLVKVFENAGYHTIGMHPYLSNGWGRNRVYPALGFDDIYFIDDLEWDDYVRDFVSDKGFVHQVINLFEHRDYDEPMFLFGVTMQNHSGYQYPGFASDVRVTGSEGVYPNVEQYLSLIRLTDDAIEELIEYFSAVDEPVQIVFFGDHQPTLENSFYRAVGMKSTAQKYLIPFVMWDNYAHRVEDAGLTSVNYLGARLLELTGIQKPAWYSFLSELNKVVPAIDHIGRFEGDTFYYRDEDGGAEAEALLEEYNIYQYANMFDDAADPTLFVGEAHE